MVKSVFGGANISDHLHYNTPELRAELLDTLLENGVTSIDTARLYPGAEAALGTSEKRSSFAIDTKLVGGFAPGNVSKEAIIRDTKASLSTVGITQFDVFYLHAPDTSTPFEEQLAGINEAYKAGIFRRFGLSNFTANQVQTVYDIAKEHGYPLPTVYQGNYNPVARHLETQLFPTLRKLGICFYAYSPLAGGFLTKSAADLDAGVGRFSPEAIGGMYKSLYDHASLRRALLTWNEVAEKEGIPKAELAYRWMAFHSALTSEEDAVVSDGAGVEEGET